MKSLYQILILLIFFTNLTSQCLDFESKISNWEYINTLGSSSPKLSPANTFDTGNNSNSSLSVIDRSGSTLLYNHSDFAGNYSDYFGRCLCFDLKLIKNDTAVKPTIIFVQDFDPKQKIVWGNNPVKAVKFTSNKNVLVNNKWENICVSFDKCVDNNFPNNIDGSWEVLGQGDCNTFNDVMSRVDGILLPVDMTAWTGTEKFNLDNICIKECKPEPDLCCPPIYYEEFLSMFDVSGDFQKHSISFTPTLAWREKMQAYTNWRHTMNPCLESFTFNATIRKAVDGTTNTFNLASNTSLAGVWVTFKANDPNAHCYSGGDLSKIKNGAHTFKGTFPSNRWHRIHAASWFNPGSCYGWADGLCEPWNIGFNYNLQLVKSKTSKVEGKLSKIISTEYDE